MSENLKKISDYCITCCLFLSFSVFGPKKEKKGKRSRRYKGKGTDEFDFMKIQNICSVKISEKSITKARD